MATEERMLPQEDQGFSDQIHVLPEPSLDSYPFWQSCHDHAMALQWCLACERFWYHPGPICPRCGSLEFDWRPVSGDGTVFSFSWNYRPARGFEDLVPYAYVIVELAEDGVMMVSNIDGSSPEELHIGSRVRVVYKDITPQITLPWFAVVEEGEGS
jgi:uncharacterized OB-fold protein